MRMSGLETIVIATGAGFLGSHLCERLLADGCSVICLDNFCTGTPANVAHLIENRAFRLMRYDVTEYLYVGGPVDAVLHFASPASPVDYLELPIETLKVGSIGTIHALGLAREKGARFLLASTSEVYGDPLVHPQGEDYWGNVNPVGPRGVYDEAKRFAEALTHGPTARTTRSTRRSCVSSTPTARGCGRTTAGPSPRSSTRRCTTRRSRCPATVARPGRSATSATWSRAS